MINWVELHREAWNQIQVAKAADRLAHALLLTGSAGIGKLEFAETVAAALLCDQPGADGLACGSCTACTWHASGNHPDFRRLRPEAYSEALPEAEDAKPSAAKADKKKSEQIRIDQVRALESFIQVGSHRGRRIILIEPAEAMNEATANALLKSLEEPPPGVHFLLVSHAAERLLPTVRSRTRAIPLAVPTTSVALAQIAKITPSLRQADIWLNRCAGALRFAVQLAQAAEKHPNATEDALAEVGILDALLAQLPLGERMDPLALAKTCEGLIKGDQSGLRLALLIDWLQRWALDLQLVRLGAAPMVFPEQTVVLQRLASQLNDDALRSYPDFLFESRKLSGHPLNIKLFLESIFSRTIALYEQQA
ncbi:MAG: DNA polymerase III subunit delta' [Fluviibacter sp.]